MCEYYNQSLRVFDILQGGSIVRSWLLLTVESRTSGNTNWFAHLFSMKLVLPRHCSVQVLSKWHPTCSHNYHPNFRSAKCCIIIRTVYYSNNIFLRELCRTLVSARSETPSTSHAPLPRAKFTVNPTYIEQFAVNEERETRDDYGNEQNYYV